MHPFFKARKRNAEHLDSDTKNTNTAVASLNPSPISTTSLRSSHDVDLTDDSDSTDFKLALLASLHSDTSNEVLLDVLLNHDGSVKQASAALLIGSLPRTLDTICAASSSAITGYQSSLRRFTQNVTPNSTSPAHPPSKRLAGPRKGQTLHLYDPADIAALTPCTLIPNFLPPALANSLLRELLDESVSFGRTSFKLFDNVVSSPHTACFFVEDDAARDARAEYYYNGAKLDDVRLITPELAKVKPLVCDAVNHEVVKRVKERYPGGVKLKFQPHPGNWAPNSAFVNCYNGPQQSVGWHTDQLTYLGPRAVIGSISLGVAREFRVRRVLPDQDKEGCETMDDVDKDNMTDHEGINAGQISIHLPHNSLLVMHAEMQEEWKHSIAPAATITPHPIAGRRRINITYRDYREVMHPRYTPRCVCRLPCVLRVAYRKKESFGRYFWMCHGGNVPGKQGCAFFEWADFDDDGNPAWAGAETKTKDEKQDVNGGVKSEKVNPIKSKGQVQHDAEKDEQNKTKADTETGAA